MNRVNTAADLLESIRASAAPNAMTTRVIAVDGLGGAGKSTLAEHLGQALADAAVVHTDDFASWDNPTGWWPRLLEQVLEPLTENAVARYQRYDWDRKALAEWHQIKPQPFVIVEGVTASREAFRPFLAYSIWVETARDERLRRGLERDGADALPLWEEWMAREDDYVSREHPLDRADAVIDGTAWQFWNRSGH